MSDAIHRWHDYMRAPDAAALEAMLHPDVVFQSPAVHTPQRGREVTMRYLGAAAVVLGGPDFRYVNEWRGDGSAVLEFECTLADGTQVNGVDIIEWDSDDHITRFKVMIRPVRALNAVIPLMAAELAKLSPPDSSHG